MSRAVDTRQLGRELVGAGSDVAVRDSSIPERVVPLSSGASDAAQKLFPALCLLLGVILYGCSAVSPSERGHLADPMMLFNDDPLGNGIHEQHRDYREGSVGGTDAQGGGCGCG